MALSIAIWMVTMTLIAKRWHMKFMIVDDDDGVGVHDYNDGLNDFLVDDDDNFWLNLQIESFKKKRDRKKYMVWQENKTHKHLNLLKIY